MITNNYKKLEDLSVNDINFMKQIYVRLKTEGYQAGFNFADFLDIVIGRKGDHDRSIVESFENEELSKI